MGAVLVIAGSMAMGIKLAGLMKGRIVALREIERIIGYLEGELRCKHSTLGEALYSVSLKSTDAYRSWLNQLVKAVDGQVVELKDKASYEDFYSIWCRSLDTLKAHTLLNTRDINQLRDVGKALGYLDIESQQMNLNMEKELIHNTVLELDKDIGARMKNAIVLSFLGGIMTVIVLL